MKRSCIVCSYCLAVQLLLVVPPTVFGRERLFVQHPVRSRYRPSGHVDKEHGPKYESFSPKAWRHRFVHVDASTEHPDHVFSEIRSRQKTNSRRTDGRSVREAVSYMTEFVNRFRRTEAATDATDEDHEGGNFVNVEHEVEEGHVGGEIVDVSGTVVPVDGDEANQTIASDFNVTVETEYNVTIIASGSNHTNDTTTIVLTQNNATNHTDVTYRPLRMRAFLSELDGGGEHLTQEQHDLLLQDMVRPALLSWSAALRVQPVEGNLSVDSFQLVDGVSCGPGISSGLPSVPVPDEHIVLGVPDTDLIVYLNLGFREETVNRSSTEEFHSENATNITTNSSTDISHEDPHRRRMDDESTVPSIDGLPVESPKPVCNGDYLAASSFCAMDDLDRPTAALLHICIGQDFFEPSRLQLNIMTIMHELGHALGFNHISMAHFRKVDGTPWTKRDAKGQVPKKEVECTGPQQLTPDGRSFSRTVAKVTLPSPDILQFRTVRGGVRVAEVVTPSVQQVVRNHFDCQTLPGAELESGEFMPLQSGSSQVPCIGDHWERRLFKADLLNPIVDGLEFNPRFSTISLAYFADSGWYQVDLSRSSLAASWGRGAGCAFVEETCIQPTDGQVPPSYDAFFCNRTPRVEGDGFVADIHGCTPDLSHKATCSIGQYHGELPQEYQYFNHTLGANVGGSDAYMDYCPVYTGFANGQCSSQENAAVIRVNRIEKFGKRNSRCVSARITDALSAQVAKSALCLPIACVVEDHSLRVFIDGSYVKCNQKDEVLLTKDGDEVICPDPIRVCPTFFCRRDCLGTRNRVCNYTIGECVCQNGTEILDVPRQEDCPKPYKPTPSNTSSPTSPPSSPVFYDPHEDNDDLPDDDSPLADYYVPTERALVEETSPILVDSLPQFLGLIGGFLAIMVLVAVIVWSRRKGRSQSPFANVDGLTTTPEDDNVFDDNAAEDIDPTNDFRDPDKDKMLASIVVDLRVNEYNRDVLGGQRASETDASMTETEGSGVNSESFVLGDGSDDPDITGALNPDDSVQHEQQVVMRRRRHRG